MNLDFNMLKSFCFAFTPRASYLCFLQLHGNNTPEQHVDSVKYLEFTFAASHKDDEDLLRQMRILYARSNRIVKIFHNCCTKVMVELERSLYGSQYKNPCFLKFVLLTTAYIIGLYVYFFAVVPVKCLLITLFQILKLYYGKTLFIHFAIELFNKYDY